MLGSTVPTIGGLPKGFDWAKKWGCECIQIYVTLSRKWNVSELVLEEIFGFKSAWRKSPVKKVVAHIPYLVNLASPERLLWKKSKNRLKIELARAEQFGVNFLVLHPGSYGDSNKEDGILRIIEALNSISTEVNDQKTTILLETMAGQGTAIGSRFEEIAYILEKLNNPGFFGVCFDTAHVFMAGYDIRGYEGYEAVLEEFNEIIGLQRIKTIHVNDSKTKLGSRIDRHASIGDGELGLQIFHALLQDKRFLSVPKILEIPESKKKSKDNLELLRKLQSIPDLLLDSENTWKPL